MKTKIEEVSSVRSSFSFEGGRTSLSLTGLDYRSYFSSNPSPTDVDVWDPNQGIPSDIRTGITRRTRGKDME